jgi:uroporphyrinogen-III synthase
MVTIYMQVTRLNSYRTVAASWSSCDYEQAQSVHIVTFASPSTAQVWAEKLDITPVRWHINALYWYVLTWVSTQNSDYTVPVVAIGPTTAAAAADMGYRNVHQPREGSKGVEAWANAVRAAVSTL